MESTAILCSVALTLITSLLIIVKLLSPSNENSNKPDLPPSPPSFPIIGHLHLLKKPLHRTLARLSSAHGPALLLRFGSRHVLVVSSLPLAEECLTKNDLAFANRPQFPSARSLTYNYATLASAPYGPHWRNVRRIATVELLSSARLTSLSHVRSSEISSLAHDLFVETRGGEFRAVELKTRLFGLAYNVMMRTIAGKRCYGEGQKGSEDAMRFREIVEDTMSMVGASNLSDFLHVLRIIDFGGVRRRMRRLAAEQDTIWQALIDELRSRESENNRDEKTKRKKSMLEVLLELQGEAPEYYSDEIIKAIVSALFFAGTDTSSETIEWAMTLLLNHPEALEKARAEIDSAVGEGSRLVQEHDLSKLPYLNAIISETLRLCPTAPVLVPRESRQECTVGGYHVPRGTTLLVNAWAVHRDPKVWPDPSEFKPERFLASDGVGKIIPFGMGTRRCPGDGLGMRMVGLALGTMIQCFEWARIGREMIDMEETGGITLYKANHLRVMCRPRQAMVDVLSQNLGGPGDN